MLKGPRKSQSQSAGFGGVGRRQPRSHGVDLPSSRANQSQLAPLRAELSIALSGLFWTTQSLLGEKSTGRLEEEQKRNGKRKEEK